MSKQRSGRTRTQEVESLYVARDVGSAVNLDINEFFAAISTPFENSKFVSCEVIIVAMELKFQLLKDLMEGFELLRKLPASAGCFFEVIVELAREMTDDNEIGHAEAKIHDGCKHVRRRNLSTAQAAKKRDRWRNHVVQPCPG